MDSIEEIKEAQQASQEVLVSLNQALKSLQDASSWGVVDLLGGGFFSSMMKRDHIKTSNQELAEVRRTLEELDQELADIGMTLPEAISDTWSDKFFDSWLDNVLVDIKVQSEIKEQIRALEELRQSLEKLEGDLAERIKKTN
ncbi:hypothetical protein [Aerococcus sp. UMB9870]|uniref:hypothetical protein n=1 Tax=Aerococcus sp. UMB9870 TaxID=3046351 RepID=UPI00254FB399|nr:hypothetical protein [Aerococcus sp. UMB9870]MDK6369865.1 hypothetical protein [Aerococcus sp. UMB9870]